MAEGAAHALATAGSSGLATSPTLTEDLFSFLNILSSSAALAYSVSARVAAFATLTLPRVLYSVLHWSFAFSLKLDFAKVALLSLFLSSVLSYVYKVRYLNR